MKPLQNDASLAGAGMSLPPRPSFIDLPPVATMPSTLEVQIADMTLRHQPEIARLSQQAVCFTFTRASHTEREFSQMCQQANLEGLVVQASLGPLNFGLVGAMLFQAREKALHVNSFWLEQRVLGRRVEHQMLTLLGAIAQCRSLPLVVAHFKASGSNQAAAAFLEDVAAPYRRPVPAGWIYEIPAPYVARLGSRGASEAQAESLLTRPAAQ